MNSYKLQLQPHVRWNPYASPVQQLTPDVVAQAIAGATIRELTTGNWTQCTLDIQLQRTTHEAALDDIFIAAQQLGYTVVSATVSEWVNEAVQYAVLGVLSGGGVVGTASQNPTATLIAALIGGLAGASVGSQIQKESVIYQASRAYPSGWELTQTSRESANTSEFQPGFSWQ